MVAPRCTRRPTFSVTAGRSWQCHGNVLAPPRQRRRLAPEQHLQQLAAGGCLARQIAEPRRIWAHSRARRIGPMAYTLTQLAADIRETLEADSGPAAKA